MFVHLPLPPPRSASHPAHFRLFAKSVWQKLCARSPFLSRARVALLFLPPGSGRTKITSFNISEWFMIGVFGLELFVDLNISHVSNNSIIPSFLPTAGPNGEPPSKLTAKKTPALTAYHTNHECHHLLKPLSSDLTSNRGAMNRM